MSNTTHARTPDAVLSRVAQLVAARGAATQADDDVLQKVLGLLPLAGDLAVEAAGITYLTDAEVAEAVAAAFAAAAVAAAHHSTEMATAVSCEFAAGTRRSSVPCTKNGHGMAVLLMDDGACSAVLCASHTDHLTSSSAMSHLRTCSRALWWHFTKLRHPAKTRPSLAVFNALATDTPVFKSLVDGLAGTSLDALSFLHTRDYLDQDQANMETKVDAAANLDGAAPANPTSSTDLNALLHLFQAAITAAPVAVEPAAASPTAGAAGATAADLAGKLSGHHAGGVGSSTAATAASLPVAGLAALQAQVDMLEVKLTDAHDSAVLDRRMSRGRKPINRTLAGLYGLTHAAIVAVVPLITENETLIKDADAACVLSGNAKLIASLHRLLKSALAAMNHNVDSTTMKGAKLTALFLKRVEKVSSMIEYRRLMRLLLDHCAMLEAELRDSAIGDLGGAPNMYAVIEGLLSQHVAQVEFWTASFPFEATKRFLRSSYFPAMFRAAATGKAFGSWIYSRTFVARVSPERECWGGLDAVTWSMQDFDAAEESYNTTRVILPSWQALSGGSGPSAQPGKLTIPFNVKNKVKAIVTAVRAWQAANPGADAAKSKAIVDTFKNWHASLEREM